MLEVPGSKPGISTLILFLLPFFLLQTETGTVLHALSDETISRVSFFYCNAYFVASITPAMEGDPSP